MGGTGHIGSAIARRLAASGYRVTATGRSTRARPNLARSDVQIETDGDPATLIPGHSLVVDAATPYPIALHQHNKPDVVKSAVLRSRKILRATRDTGASFVHISSFTTLPRPHQSPLSQVSQGVVQGLHKYFDVKQQVENEVSKALADGVKGTILNPATCFGPYDLKPRNQTFIPMLLSGKVQALARHDLNIVDVRDVADILCASVEKGFPDRQIPVFGHTISLPALATQICRIGGKAPPRLQLPSVLGLAGLYWIETAFALTGRESPWPSLTMALVSASYAAKPSAEQTSLVPVLRPLDQILGDAVQWYRSIGSL